MPNYAAPGVYIEEVSGGARPIEAASSSIAAFLGVAPKPDAHLNEAVPINNWSQFLKEFWVQGSASTDLAQAVFGYFYNGGRYCYVVNVGKDNPLVGDSTQRRGLDLLKEKDDVSIVVAPGYTDVSSYEFIMSHCENMKDRFAILDSPATFKGVSELTQVGTVQPTKKPRGAAAAPEEGSSSDASTGRRPRDSAYAAVYGPWILVPDALDPKNIISAPPSGHLAGIYARTDGRVGVHKAPANEIVNLALGLSYNFTHEEQELLNPRGVNCIRFFQREGIRVWGARTLHLTEWKYINVRRLFIMVEQSIARGTRWVVFEPNDRTLWGHVIRDVTAFLTVLYRQGALMGRTPSQAFFVKCDEETNPPEEIDLGRLTIEIGLAPVKPAEFVIFRIGQTAGGTEVTGGSNG